MVVLLAMLLAATAARGQTPKPAASASWSTVKMAACKPGDAVQGFEVDTISGTGRIRDKATGRCLTLKTCSPMPVGIQQSIEVGLQECGVDDCDGQGSQWLASAAAVPGSVMFSSVLKGTAGECYVLNVRNADTLPVVAYGDPICSDASKNNQWLEAKDAETMKSATGWECGTDCCITADPCVAPACVLPAGWAWPFVLTMLIGGTAYFAGGVGYAVKASGVAVTGPGSALKAHPHSAQWASVAGLCADGAQFTRSKVNENRAGKPSSAGGAGGFEKLGEATAPLVTTAAVLPQGTGAAGGPPDGDNSSDDDGVVE
jgi:hypothetical protein